MSTQSIYGVDILNKFQSSNSTFQLRKAEPWISFTFWDIQIFKKYMF